MTPLTVSGKNPECAVGGDISLIGCLLEGAGIQGNECGYGNGLCGAGIVCIDGGPASLMKAKD